MAIDFAAHAPSQEDKEKNALELVGEQVKQLDDLLEEQTAKLEELAELEEKIKAINEKYLPDLFEEYGLADIRLKDGRKLVLNNKWRPSITQENMAEAYEWLKDHGHGDLIKNAINIKFKKEESKKALELLKYLLNEGFIKKMVKTRATIYIMKEIKYKRND